MPDVLAPAAVISSPSPFAVPAHVGVCVYGLPQREIELREGGTAGGADIGDGEVQAAGGMEGMRQCMRTQVTAFALGYWKRT